MLLMIMIMVKGFDKMMLMIMITIKGFDKMMLTIMITVMGFTKMILMITIMVKVFWENTKTLPDDWASRVPVQSYSSVMANIADVSYYLSLNHIRS